MAYSQVTAALDIGNLTPGCKLLLVVMALGSDYRGGIRTSYRHLEKQTGLTTRTLRTSLAQLEALGHIRRVTPGLLHFHIPL